MRTHHFWAPLKSSSLRSKFIFDISYSDVGRPVSSMIGKINTSFPPLACISWLKNKAEASDLVIFGVSKNKGRCKWEISESTIGADPSAIFLFIVEFQWFFIALSVRPGKNLAIIAHLLPYLSIIDDTSNAPALSCDPLRHSTSLCWCQDSSDCATFLGTVFLFFLEGV